LPKTPKDRDSRTLQRLTDVLAESGREFSPEQALVADAFMAAEAHQTIASIHDCLSKAGHRIDVRCVESTMEILCEHKIAKPLRFDDRVVYEHYHPESHHDHLFCVKCGTIVEFFDPRIEELQTDNAKRADFRLLLHNLNIYGVCHNCIKLESHTRSLAQCLAGERVRVVRIQADSATQARVSEMGLRLGSIVQVLSDDCFGRNVIALVGETRIMLDREIAEKVKAMPADLEHFRHRGRRRLRHHHRPDTVTGLVAHPRDHA
jgi:Fur family ferric uptake transcriptional regulator